MTHLDFAAAIEAKRPDALYLHHDAGHCIQAISPLAYETLSTSFPLDTRGGFVWPRLPDSEADEAELERIFMVAEAAGLVIRFG